jgi:uncharacterized protein (DUF2252 family)
MAMSSNDPRARGPGVPRAQRAAAGKALRRLVPRSSHGRWEPRPDRPDPIAILQAADASRVAALRPIRYGRMSLSPFHFLRGAAAVMAEDLGPTPTTGLRVQLGGDAHLSNFGLFGTPERDLVFDVNDFDETLPGPWEWDIKRLAASIVVAGRVQDVGRPFAAKAARRAVRSYRKGLTGFARMRYLDAWYAHLDLTSLPTPVHRAGRTVMAQDVAAARRRTGLHAFPKLARRVRGRYRIRDDPPLIHHYEDPADAETSREFFERYLGTLPDERRMLLDRYHVEDVAQKVVGVGSVGTRCSTVLLTADRDMDDPLLLQLKEAQASVWEGHAGASLYPNHAERVVVGQHLIQEASDIFLGWSRLNSRDFYLRQLRDMKLSTDLAGAGPKALLGQAELCGSALARSHARTGDPTMIAGYLGSGDVFDRAITEFAERYADQTEKDHAALLRAIRSRRVIARVDV